MTRFILLCLAIGASPAAWSQPNVFLVMTDDQGYGDFSLHGNPYLQTPNLDRFAEEGVQFSNFHVSPFCAPTRASLLTGRYSLRTGVTGVTANAEVMRSEEVTLAEALRPAGYRTACIGKWHNGEQYPHNAVGQGFDEFLGFNAGHFNNYFDPVLLRGTKPEATTGYITDVLTAEAIAFMDRNRENPWFCYLSLNAPHTPSQAPDRFVEPFEDSEATDENAAIYAMCRSIDENFGHLLVALEERDLRENTIVLFLTDNGANTDRFNAGMRGRKTSVHEGGTRVPLFVQWPARIQKPRIVNQLAAHLDLFPTLFDLLDLEPPEGPARDGISLMPWIDGQRDDVVDRNIFVYSAQKQPAVPFPAAVRTERWRMVCEDRRASADEPTWQLYDMAPDPGETTDLAGTHPEIVRGLEASWGEWWDEVKDGWAPAHRIEVGHPEENPVHLHATQVSARGGLLFGIRMLREPQGAHGFAHDWLADWKSTEAHAEWSLNVVDAGRYRVTLECNVNEADAGSLIRVTAGDSSVENRTTAFPGESIPLPHLTEGQEIRYIDRTWDEQEVGVLNLPAGPIELQVEATEIPGQQAMLLKGIILERLP